MAAVTPRAAGRAALRAGLAALLACWAVACGEPLATADYEGEPLATLVGGVFETEPGLIHRDDLRAAVFWSPDGVSTDDLEALVEQPSTAQPVGLPNDYVLHLYDEPDSALLVATGDAPADGVWAIGRILVYPDEDGDGRRGTDEPFLGGVRHSAVVFAARDLGAEESPTGRALPAGFHLLVLPLACGRPVSAPVGDGRCDVPLGAPCSADTDCSPGLCLLHQPFLAFPWPGGACAQPDPAPPGCDPAGAGLIAALPGGPSRAFWVQGCRSDADCERPGSELPYLCDVGAGACVPAAPLRIELGVTVGVSPFCAVAPEPAPAGAAQP